MRRRRKPRVVWLPPDPTNRIGGIPTGAVAETDSGWFRFSIGVAGAAGTHTTAVQPLFSDIPSIDFQAGGAPVSSLADIYDSGYRLRRIVGKLFVAMRIPAAEPVGNAAELAVTAGIIVLRTGPSGEPLGTTALADTLYAPSIIKSWSDPWIWRRSWIVGNPVEAASGPNAGPFWPETNAAYGSVMDGPHIDQKTARIIGPEERVFMVIDCMTPVGLPQQGAGEVFIYGDIRGLASMRTTVGNRRNASR